MFPELSMSLIAIFMVWLTGALTLFLIFQKELSLLEITGYSYLLGSGIVAVFLCLSSIIGGKLSLVSVFVFMTSEAGISAALWFKNRRTQLKKSRFTHQPFRYYEYLLILLILFITTAVIAEGISGEPGWDAIFTYGFVAKTFFLSNRIDMGFFTDAARYGFVHLDYPLLFPLLITWCYKFLGTADPQIIQLITIGFYLAIIGIYSGSLRDSVSRPFMLLSLALVLYNPLILYDTLRGEADIIVAVYFMGILALYLKFKQSPSAKMAALLGILIGFVANTKNEGFVFLALLQSEWVKKASCIEVTRCN